MMKSAKKIQILVLGDGRVGKTSLLRMYSEGTFTTHHLTTIGIDFITKDFTIDDEKIQVKIWDTAGQERFRTITHTFYKQADGVLLVYDVTDRETFNNVSIWVDSISDHANKGIMKYLIGNKTDIKEERKVTEKEGTDIARKDNMKFFETSAKNNVNVSESIESLIREIHKNDQLNNNHNDIGGSTLSNRKIKKREKESGCCKK